MTREERLEALLRRMVMPFCQSVRYQGDKTLTCRDLRPDHPETWCWHCVVEQELGCE